MTTLRFQGLSSKCVVRRNPLKHGLMKVRYGPLAEGIGWPEPFSPTLTQPRLLRYLYQSRRLSSNQIFVNACRLLKRIAAVRAAFLTRSPLASPGLVDCRMRLAGRVLSSNRDAVLLVLDSNYTRSVAVENLGVTVLHLLGSAGMKRRLLKNVCYFDTCGLTATTF